MVKEEERDGAESSTPPGYGAPSEGHFEEASSSRRGRSGTDPCTRGGASHWGADPWNGSQLLRQRLPVFWEGHRGAQRCIGALRQGEVDGYGPRSPVDVGFKQDSTRKGSPLSRRLQSGVRRPWTGALPEVWGDKALDKLADLVWRDVFVSAVTTTDELAGLGDRMDELPDPG